MILNEISNLDTRQQVSRIFEQYFGQRFDVDGITPHQARHMLRRVRAALAEHRGTSAVWQSENNGSYLRMVMMEQALDQHIKSFAAATRAIMEESDVQQAQVLLAAQDMVDKVQKMIEDISEMQYKELPALVDSIRNQVGTAEADTFNQSATAALQGLVQNLQGSKTQLEQSQATLTGEAMAQPAALDGTEMPGEMPAEPAAGGEEEVDLSLDANLEEPEPEPAADLGRERR